MSHALTTIGGIILGYMLAKLSSTESEWGVLLVPTAAAFLCAAILHTEGK